LLILAKHSDEHAKPATIFIKNEAVLLHDKVNLGQELLFAMTDKDILDLGKDTIIQGM
jgi:hypothetical protein